MEKVGRSYIDIAGRHRLLPEPHGFEDLFQPESWAQISVAFPFREYEVITKVSAS